MLSLLPFTKALPSKLYYYLKIIVFVFVKISLCTSPYTFQCFHSNFTLLQEEQHEIQGYIQQVDQLETSGRVKYFNFTIQTKNEVLRAVSFSPQKKRQLENMASTKSPTKLSNIRIKNEQGNDNLYIMILLLFKLMLCCHLNTKNH